MPYNVTIRSDAGDDIGGLITFLDQDGDKLGEQIVPPGGVDIDSGAYSVAMASTYRISHPGYSALTTSELYDDTIFTLYRESVLPLLLGGAVIFWLLSKFFK